MLSEADLHRLVADISSRASRAAAASQERIACCRQSMSQDAERKNITEQAVAVSLDILDRARS